MLQKNVEKEKRKARPLWNGYYVRKTPTKREKLEKLAKKHKKGLDKCTEQVYNIGTKKGATNEVK